MKVTKYIHSCLLVEDQGKTILIDPGEFTYEAKVLGIEKLAKLDYIAITHEHQDHVSISFIKELLEKFPNTQIFSNNGVATLLQKENIPVLTTGNEYITITEAPHEKLFTGYPLPQNSLITLFGKLSHPGDSLHFDKTTEILALPVQAPWGNTIEIAEKAASLNPKIILPIHDWHWQDQARKSSYQMLKTFFGTKGIEFKELETGVTIELI